LTMTKEMSVRSEVDSQGSRNVLLQAVLIVLVSSLIGIAGNAVSSRSVPLDYREVKAEEVARLRSAAQESNIPVIHLKDALGLHREGVTQFMDARSMESYEAAHIPGAVPLPVGEFQERLSEATEGLGKEDPIVTYCSGAGCHSSVRLAEQLIAAGFVNVKAFLGGWEEWTQAKLPTESGVARKEGANEEARQSPTKKSAVVPAKDASPVAGDMSTQSPPEPQKPSISKPQQAPVEGKSNTAAGKDAQSKATTSEPRKFPKAAVSEPKRDLSESLKEIHALFESGDCIFIDARMPDDYAKGHIPNAVPLPLELFNEVWPQVAHRIGRDRILITYCDGKDCNSSEALADKLRELGFTSVRSFVGGWNAWRRAGYSTEKGS